MADMNPTPKRKRYMLDADARAGAGYEATPRVPKVRPPNPMPGEPGGDFGPGGNVIMDAPSSDAPVPRVPERSVGLPYERPKTVGLPVERPLTVGLPVERPLTVGLPYERPRTVGLPVERPLTVGLPVERQRTVGLPVERPPVGLPVERPPVGLPYERPGMAGQARIAQLIQGLLARLGGGQ